MGYAFAAGSRPPLLSLQGANPQSVNRAPVSLVVMEGVLRNYQMGPTTVRALGPVDLTIEPDEFVVILGPSGSGKSTLLNLVAGIDPPTQGRLQVAGSELAGMGRQELLEYRRKNVGVVFQSFNLIPNLTALENVELVAEFTGSLETSSKVLESVGLGHRLDHFPHELSGGEQQRVAIARALVKEPPLILGDEPTGNLDQKTSKKILKLFQEVHRSGKCVVLVTHNLELSRLATRVLEISDGRIVANRVKESEDAELL